MFDLFDKLDLFDNLEHLLIVNRSRAVLVDLTKALVEVSVVEASTVEHIGECVANKLLSLFLVQVFIAIFVVLTPDLVDALVDVIVDFRSVKQCAFNQIGIKEA